jgi:hypothetical protein
MTDVINLGHADGSSPLRDGSAGSWSVRNAEYPALNAGAGIEELVELECVAVGAGSGRDNGAVDEQAVGLVGTSVPRVPSRCMRPPRQPLCEVESTIEDGGKVPAR